MRRLDSGQAFLADCVEDLDDEVARQTARNKNDLRGSPGTGPSLQLVRRVEQVLHSLDHDRLFPPDDRKNTLHPKQLIAMSHDESIEPICDMLPVQRLLIIKAE